jgi:FtsZ-binding cell division protein ZapB
MRSAGNPIRRFICVAFVAIAGSFVLLGRLPNFDYGSTAPQEQPAIDAALNQMNDLQAATQSEIESLKEKVNSLRGETTERTSQIDTLNSQISELKSQMSNHIQAESAAKTTTSSAVVQAVVSTVASALGEWRTSIKSACDSATTSEQLQAIQNSVLSGFAFPDSDPPQQPRGDEAVKRCKHVVIDFGANIGDTSEKMIDAGLPGCDRAELGKVERPHMNMEAKQVTAAGRNSISDTLDSFILKLGQDVGPEAYCYYGVEGNPHFTERLQKREDLTMATTPRPLAHLHFFTESVGAGVDGMTQLFLDTVNAGQNYWGSSIIKTHQDVQRSGATQAADVMGYTITTLMKKTLQAFNPEASESEKSGGHLILKIDIEGAEVCLCAHFVLVICADLLISCKV